MCLWCFRQCIYKHKPHLYVFLLTTHKNVYYLSQNMCLCSNTLIFSVCLSVWRHVHITFFSSQCFLKRLTVMDCPYRVTSALIMLCTILVGTHSLTVVHIIQTWQLSGHLHHLVLASHYMTTESMEKMKKKM